MSDPTEAEFDDESHMRRAIELAREAVARGDRPFGSVLVREDSVVMSESNRVNTEDDIRRHPELHLAYRACRELSPGERAETVMYTSSEPSVRSREILDGVTEVRGPVLSDEGRRIHEEFDW